MLFRASLDCCISVHDFLADIMSHPLISLIFFLHKHKAARKVDDDNTVISVKSHYSPANEKNVKTDFFFLFFPCQSSEETQTYTYKKYWM